MISQGGVKLCIELRTVDSVYLEILDNFVAPSIDQLFGDSDYFIFKDDNAILHRTKSVKTHLQNLGTNRFKVMP